MAGEVTGPRGEPSTDVLLSELLSNCLLNVCLCSNICAALSPRRKSFFAEGDGEGRNFYRVEVLRASDCWGLGP